MIHPSRMPSVPDRLPNAEPVQPWTIRWSWRCHASGLVGGAALSGLPESAYAACFARPAPSIRMCATRV